MTIYVEVTPNPIEAEISWGDIVNGLAGPEDEIALADKLVRDASYGFGEAIVDGLVRECEKDSVAREKINAALGRNGYRVVKL